MASVRRDGSPDGPHQLVIDDELDKQFRKEVNRRFGMKKGNIKIAIKEAMKLWIAKDIIIS